MVYTEARLKGNKQASDLAESMSSLLPEVEDLRKSQRGMWRAEIVAQAAVDAINDELDDLVAARSPTETISIPSRWRPS